MKLKLTLITCIAVGSLFMWARSLEVTPKNTAPAPNFAITEELSLHDLPKKETWIHFWASWCPPCVVEMPKLLEHFKGDDTRTLVLVSLDKKQKALENFLNNQDTGVLAQSNVLSMWDQHGDVAEDYQSFQYPETYVLDKNFELIRKIKGDSQN